MWKIKGFLTREKDTGVKQAEPLKLVPECGTSRLRIGAEQLDVLPKGLTVSTVHDESFRKGTGGETAFDPVFFAVQFPGGEWLYM